MKKKLLNVMTALVITASMVLTGCGAAGNAGTASEKDTNATTNTDAPAKDTEEKAADGSREVVRMVVPGISEQSTIDPISGITSLGLSDFEKFLQEQIPDYEIKLTTIPWDGWIQKMETLVTSGEVDVGFFTNQEAVPGWYMDLSGYLDKDTEVNFDNLPEWYIDPAVYYTRYHSFNYPENTSQVFGLPMTMACNLIVYDKQLFDEWGVPEPTEGMTMSELIDLSNKLTGKNPKTGIQNYGAYVAAMWMEWFSISYDAVKSYESDTMLVSEMDTAEYVDYMQTSPEVLNYFSDMIKLVDNCPEGVATSSGGEKFFTQDNDIAINFDTNAAGSNYMKYVYGEDEGVTSRFKPLLIPKGANGMEGFPEFFRFAITKTAKNPDAAWDVIKKLTTSPEIVDFYLTNYARDKISALVKTDGMKMMEYDINQKRHSYQVDSMFRSQDYWYWRVPLQTVNNKILSRELTAEQARDEFYKGALDWVNNTKKQLGQ